MTAEVCVRFRIRKQRWQDTNHVVRIACRGVANESFAMTPFFRRALGLANLGWPFVFGMGSGAIINKIYCMCNVDKTTGSLVDSFTTSVDVSTLCTLCV